MNEKQVTEGTSSQKSKKGCGWRGVLALVVLLLLAGAAVAFYFKYYFVYSEGVEAGTLNYIEKKGYVFKTYEGRLIQEGLKGRTGTMVMSNEFIFSVENDSVAAQLMRCSGKTVELHYARYKGELPWRGQSHYVVDGVLSVR